MEQELYEEKFTHDVKICWTNLFPCDIFPGKALNDTLKYCQCSNGIGYLLSSELVENSKMLLTNLFWLFFCAKFQPDSMISVAV